jgi:hypothetical protein
MRRFGWDAGALIAAIEAANNEDESGAGHARAFSGLHLYSDVRVSWHGPRSTNCQYKHHHQWQRRDNRPRFRRPSVRDCPVDLAGAVTVNETILTGGYAPDAIEVAAGGFGGAVFVFGSLTVTSSVISGNRGGMAARRAQGGHGGDGGAIWVSQLADSVSVVNSTISGNSAGNGGSGNTGGIGGNGGGVVIFGGSVSITNSSISGNSAGNGGANNGSGGTGGGIHVAGGTVNITNSTIAGNSAGAAIGSGFPAPAGHPRGGHDSSKTIL